MKRYLITGKTAEAAPLIKKAGIAFTNRRFGTITLEEWRATLK